MVEIETKESEGKDESNPPSDREALETWLADQDESIQTMFKDGIAGLTSALAKEREAAKEAASLKKQLDEANEKLDGFKSDEEKELDGLKAEVETLTSDKAAAEQTAAEATDALEKARISFTVTANALKMGFSDPADAEALLPADAITINEDGEVEGAEKALEELAKAKPYLLDGSGDGIGTPRGASKKKMSSDDKRAPIQPNLRF